LRNSKLGRQWTWNLNQHVTYANANERAACLFFAKLCSLGSVMFIVTFELKASIAFIYIWFIVFDSLVSQTEIACRS
jgi:hypothetical protein